MTEDKSRMCILQILKSHSHSLSTQEILDETKLYPDICRGCKSGSNILRIALKLVNEGVISRELAKGGFQWKIN